MSRLSQMLTNEQNRSGRTEREIASEFGWGQQTFNTWKKGSVPRPKMFAAIARFLKLNEEQVAELAEEALTSTGNTKLPDVGVAILAREAGGQLVFDEPIGFAKPNIRGCYAVRVGGRHVWVNPKLRPVDGNEVVIRNGDEGRMATWPTAVEGDDEVHVVVLRETV
ncbi:XRE family transcriptional regulator [Ferirhizobium litorale]|uniref:XRE family transcriptional regulator n=1 Tax=Ferirhizobium litorale TaxID=2927786 RepID=A0AAE3U362_9HYPH|nr:XRE family transcriptional regulator [Fererhizobium litorale]MDI7923382.1 XRE family transcriptional regulator [Fererhizobium litorale]